MRPFRAHDFPLTESAVELRDVAIMQHPDPCREGAQEFAIMADQDHGPLVPLDRILERFDRLHVQMVRGFVEHQQVVP